MRIILLLILLVGCNAKNDTAPSRPKRLWCPPNSWENGDGVPSGHDGVDLSKWRK
jgi:hypothetical protein